MALLPVIEAQAQLLSSVRPIADVETISLHEADGRVLAEPVLAQLTQPPFDSSAMDGYAVRAADVAALGSSLRLIGESAAGRGFSGSVAAGETVRIFTGAPMPAGADCVLLQEDAERFDTGLVRNAFSPERGRHVRPRGQDFEIGDTLLAAGMVLDPARLMLAAGANCTKVAVYRKPVVGLIATGDELVTVGGALMPDQIVASSGFAVGALARRAGADVVDFGIVPDDRDQIASAVRRAEAHGVDVLITLGGASVGDHDLVQSVLKSVGMTLDFWRIAMRPGKPLMVGALGPVKVLGLPGNPVSSMVCAVLFLEPLLAALGRRPAPARARTAVTLADLPANDQRQDYVRASQSRMDDGQLAVKAFGKQDSSQMKILAHSDALIIRPAHGPAVAAGSPCDILALREID